LTLEECAFCATACTFLYQITFLYENTFLCENAFLYENTFLYEITFLYESKFYLRTHYTTRVLCDSLSTRAAATALQPTQTLRGNVYT